MLQSEKQIPRPEGSGQALLGMTDQKWAEDAWKDEALDSQASKVQFTDGFNDLAIGAE